MRTKHLAWLWILALPLMSSTCGDDESPFGGSLAEFRKHYGPQSQYFHTSTAEDFQFSGREGAQVKVAANSYQQSPDSTAFSGRVQFELMEILNQRHLILSGVFTQN